MKMLAIDTSTLVMGVAVLTEEKVLGELITNSKKKHSVRLMPAIAQLLQELELSFDQIDLIAVTSGPGSYTGIRIGVATAKTLSWANHLPLYGVSTLDVLAANGQHFDGFVVPLLDARRDRVYTAIYECGKNKLTPLLSPRVISISDLLAQLADQTKPVLFLGDDVATFAAQINERLSAQAVLGTPALHIPRPSQLGQIAWAKWRNQQPPVEDDFAPDYLQLTQAETNWLNQQQKCEQNHGK